MLLNEVALTLRVEKFLYPPDFDPAPASEALVGALPVDRASHLGGALQFFLFDTPEVLLLLTGIVFVMGMINSTFAPERTRALLAGAPKAWSVPLAVLVGVPMYTADIPSRIVMWPWHRTSFATSSSPTTSRASMTAGWPRGFRQSRTGTCTSGMPSRSA